MKLSESKISVSQIILFFILSNLFINEFSFRIDISSTERLTLSGSTKSRLYNLNKPISIEAYYSSDLPIEYSVRLELIKEFLLELKKQNKDMIAVSFYDPGTSPELRDRALKLGLLPNEIQKSSETSKSFQEVFMGIVIKYDDQVEFISDFFFVEEAESQFVRSLRRMEQKQKIQMIAVIRDPGCFETPLPGNGSAINTWGVFYHQALTTEYGQPFEISLNEGTPVPSEIKLFLVVGSPEWNETAKQTINDFVLRGGRIIFLLNPLNFQITPVRNEEGLAFDSEKLVYPSSGYSHWDDLLNNFGLDFGPNLLFDFEHPVSLVRSERSQNHDYALWHYFLKSEGNLHQNHELTNTINLLIMPWVSSLKIDKGKQKEVQYDVILSTARQIWKKENVFTLAREQSFKETEIERNRIAVGVLGEGKFKFKQTNESLSENAKIFVLSSPFFISDILSLPEFRSTFRDSNVSFLLNVIDYMLDDKEFILSREKKLAVTPLKSFSSNERNIYSFFNTLFIPFLLILYAVRRIQMRYSGITR